MIKKALRIGQLITDAHPSDVRLLFKAYNIKAEPTGKSIIDAYLVYGKPFLMELFNIGYKSVNTLSSTDGEDYKLETDKVLARGASATAAGTEAGKAKAFSYEGFANIFDIGAGILTSAKGLYEGIASIFTGGKAVNTGATSADAALREEIIQAKIDAQAAESANATKTYLLIGAGLLVAVLVGIMFLKRK